MFPARSRQTGLRGPRPAPDDDDRITADDVPGPPPPRPRRRTFSVCCGAFEQHLTSRPGLTVAGVIAEELEDWRSALAWRSDRGEDLADFAASQGDRSIWEDGRLAAAIRFRAEAPAEPEVITFDA